MDQKFNASEREFIRLAGFFKKNAITLKEQGKMSEEYLHLLETCDKLLEQLNIHAENRTIILGQQEQLKELIKDNALCPKCGKNAHLKLVGTDKSPQGWVSNKYKCRRCNIEFVWNAPNNPWDMIGYVEHVLAELEKKMEGQGMDESTLSQNAEAMAPMKANLANLKPVIAASQQNLLDLEGKEKIMSEMILKVNKHLMIEKIRMS
jgi:hypothetical protein